MNIHYYSILLDCVCAEEEIGKSMFNCSLYIITALLCIAPFDSHC